MSEEILARVSASGPRRGFGVFVLGGLGIMLIYLAFAAPPAGLAYQAMLLGFGAISVYAAKRMWEVSQLSLELTGTVLRLSDGTILARTSDIVGIDRGTFAFKPSHGFMVKLAEKSRFGWHPGMWWRIGRRLAVGGITPGAQTKIMADILTAMIAARAETRS